MTIEERALKFASQLPMEFSQPAINAVLAFARRERASALRGAAGSMGDSEVCAVLHDLADEEERKAANAHE